MLSRAFFRPVARSLCSPESGRLLPASRPKWVRLQQTDAAASVGKAGQSDALKYILNDHKEIFATYRAFRVEEANPDPAARHALAHELIKLMTVHTSVEDCLLYPTVRRLVKDGGQIVERSIAEHNKIDQGLAELHEIQPQHPRFPEKLYAVMDIVSKHVEDEELSVLPALKQAVKPEQLAALGAAMEHYSKAVPHHPPALKPASDSAKEAAAARAKAAREAAKGPPELPGVEEIKIKIDLPKP